jgi:hypothetical protein
VKRRLKTEGRRQKAEDKGISPQRHKDQHKGPQRRQQTREEKRVQKTEGREHEGNKGGHRGDTGFVSFVVSCFCLLF